MFRSTLFEHFLIEAHPRSRGEKLGDDALSATPTGASPLTRGKQAASRDCCVAARLIPAHARKTTCIPKRQSALRAHPRSRGENVSPPAGRPRRPGSSPLTRRKRGIQPSPHGPRRLIPAHAGKTLPRCGAACGSSAHPRSRGENLMYQVTPATMRGSSPLTRGKLVPS